VGQYTRDMTRGIRQRDTTQWTRINICAPICQHMHPNMSFPRRRESTLVTSAAIATSLTYVIPAKAGIHVIPVHFPIYRA